ncbi:MAG: FecR domain-containing protein [Steroidobacteraceae bacterium]
MRFSPRWFVVLAFGGACVCPPQLVGAEVTAGATPAEAEFVYRFLPRDTLIQVARRLLLQPQRWPELQARNGIINPRSIAPDTPIRIPYSWLRLGTDTAQVQTVSGTVTRDGVALLPGEILPEGAVIETGADGSMSLGLADGSTATLQKSSVLKLDQLRRAEGVDDGHSAQLRLESGRLETTVKPKRDVGRFEIVTPVAISAVRGTQFRTSFDMSAGNATTETLEGTVNVSGSNNLVGVAAGFGTRVEASGAVLSPVPLLSAPDLSAVPETNTRSLLQVQLRPIADAVAYRVQLAADAQFRSITFDSQSPQLVVDIPEIADGEHWLRVRGIDRFGIEGMDAVRMIVQRTLPEPPLLLSPASEARVPEAAALLEWAPVSRAGNYRVQLARDAQFSDIVMDREIAAATRFAPSDLPAGRYVWRVAGIDSRGQMGVWSAARAYLQQAAAPRLESPQIGARELTLRWSATSAQRYRIQVAGDAQFEHLLVDTRLDAAQLTLPKPVPGTWYARVQVLDTDGVADPFGQTCRFEVPMSLWLKIVLSSTVLVPLLL